MLTCLLLLTTMCVVQDAAPEAAAPVAAPTSTPDNVRAFLDGAQARLYDPRTAGLESLAFDLPIDLPAPIGTVGTAHVTWSREAEGQATMSLREGFQLPPGMPFTAEMLEAQGVQQGLQFLGNVLNQHIASLLDTGVATMGGVRDGLVAVSYAAPDAASQGIVSQSFLFDEESTLQRMVLAARAPSPMGGEMDVTLTQAFTWKPAGAGSDGLVIATQVVDTDMGMMQQKDEATFDYRTVGDLVVLQRISTVRNLPALVGGGQQTQVLEARNLVVNGTAAAKPAAPASVPAPAEEPAPAGG